MHRMPQSELLLHILPEEGISLLVTWDSVPWRGMCDPEDSQAVQAVT